MFLSKILTLSFMIIHNFMKKTFLSSLFTIFYTEEISKRLIKDCFKSNGEQRVIMPKNGEYAKFESCEKEIKSPCIIYADIESILVPKDNRNQNPEVSYTKNLNILQSQKTYCLHLWI